MEASSSALSNIGTPRKPLCEHTWCWWFAGEVVQHQVGNLVVEPPKLVAGENHVEIELYQQAHQPAAHLIVDTGECFVEGNDSWSSYGAAGVVQDASCDISAVAAVNGHFGTVPVAPSDS